MPIRQLQNLLSPKKPPTGLPTGLPAAVIMRLAGGSISIRPVNLMITGPRERAGG